MARRSTRRRRKPGYEGAPNGRKRAESRAENQRAYGSQPHKPLIRKWSGRPDSNRRRPAWEGANGLSRNLPCFTFPPLDRGQLYHHVPWSTDVSAEPTAEGRQNHALRTHRAEMDTSHHQRLETLVSCSSVLRLHLSPPPLLRVHADGPASVDRGGDALPAVTGQEDGTVVAGYDGILEPALQPPKNGPLALRLPLRCRPAPGHACRLIVESIYGTRAPASLLFPEDPGFCGDDRPGEPGRSPG
jgi:hypothetical protein